MDKYEGSWFFGMERKLQETIKHELDKKDVPLEGRIEFYTEIVDTVATEFAEIIVKTLKTSMPTLLEENKKQRDLFKNNICALWKKPLDMLEAFLHMSIEVGETINREVREQVNEDNCYLIDVLTRLHGRACLIASEILTLLKNGYADGANARWRALHEVVVIAAFIQENGNEIAERYLNHNTIESSKALKEYQDHSRSLSLPSFSKKEVKKINEERNSLINKYGKSYDQSYGWAASVIKNPTIPKMEKSVKLDHLRPYYRMASHHIHSNPKSILFKLGLPYQSDGIILTGPSNAGLADPSQGMAISLNQINCILLKIHPSIIGIVTAKIMDIWVKELCNEFIKVHRIVEKRWIREKNKKKGKAST